ncbi:MAG: xanthine dehydrogenase family protein subunit M, partial [Syntrophales bacterium]|nr:xanthine dehydrogenase family protein subunit M [Syntrophales bacterium]
TGYQKIVDAVETAARSTSRVADRGASPTPSRLLPLSRGGGVGRHEGRVEQGTEEDFPDAPVGVTFRTGGARATQVFLPGHLDALWSCMAEHPEARVFAGGTDLLVQMRARREDAPVLIGLERIVELQGVRKTPSGFWIGAGNTHRRLLDDPRIRKDLPVLAQALRALGSPPIRNMGTIGGNLCTASPAGDALPPLYVLGAELELSTGSHRRTVPIDTFITGPGKTVLRPGEILTGIRLNRPDGYEIHHYEKVGQRKALACAIASMAALLKLSPTGVIEAARFAWGSVGPTVITSAEVEAAIIGERLSPAVLETAARLARQAVSPIDDLRASANYRRRVSGNLMLRLGTDPKTFPSSGPFSQGSSPSS